MYFLFIATLLLITAVLVMTETALVASRRSRLHAAAEKGDKGAKTAVELIDQPNRFFSTAQIGITLISILLGMFGEASVAESIQEWLKHSQYPALIPYAHWISLVITLLCLTTATLVLSELVPKRLAQMNPEGISRIMSRPMHWLSVLAAPLVYILSFATDLILKVIPLRPRDQSAQAEEEVKSILATGTEAGVFHEAEQEIVERVFKLSDIRVKSLMVPRNDIDFLLADDSIQRVRVAVATSSHSHFPICKTSLDDLTGYIHVKDLVKHGLISDQIDLGSLAKPPLFVPESSFAIKALDKFRETGVHLAFVIDEYGVLVGLITLNDILDALLGEVTPKGGEEDPLVVQRADGSYLLDGMLPVTELRELMQAPTLPKQEIADFDTLGGFVMSYLGRIPHTGDTFEFDQYAFEVVDMDRTRVDKVLLTITPPAKPATDAEGEA